MENPETRYCVAPHLSISSGEDHAVVSGLEAESARLIPGAINELIARCESFKPLAEHAAATWKTTPRLRKFTLSRQIIQQYSRVHDHFLMGPGSMERMITEIFRKYAEDGLFVSESTLLDWSQGELSESPLPPIRHVGIITCNRVESLRASLSSYMRNVGRHGREADFIVCDDSPTSEMRERNRAVAQETVHRHGRPVSYVGLEEKRALSHKLTEAGIPGSVLEFALFDSDRSQYSYGANCNAFMLHSAGNLTFVTDDDTVCRLSHPPKFEPGLKIIGSAYAREQLWFFPDRTAALASVEPADVDLLGVHEAFLGKTIGRCLREEPIPFRCDQKARQFIRDIKDGQGRVRLTHNGLLGDTGSNSARHFLFSKDGQRERLLESEEKYRSAFHSREVAKGPLQPTIVNASGCMSTFYGADNREPLPPYFPMFRDCDTLFGEMLRICTQDSYFVYLPWLLLHSPPESRFYRGQKECDDRTDGIWPSDAIQLALQSFGLGPQDASFRHVLPRVGTHLMEIGSMPLRKYARLFREMQRIKQANSLSSLKGLLKSHPKSPAYWVQDVEYAIVSSQAAIERPVHLAPVSYIRKHGVAEAEMLIQKYVYKFGELLRWWPKMFDLARELKERGDMPRTRLERR